jgi:hypothetical protein
MILQHKEITFHINHIAYTVDIGPDLDNAIEIELKRFLDLNKNISTQELLLAYLRKTQETLTLKKGINNQIQTIESFLKD